MNWNDWVSSDADGTWWCPLCGADLHWDFNSDLNVKVLHREFHLSLDQHSIPESGWTQLMRFKIATANLPDGDRNG